MGESRNCVPGSTLLIPWISIAKSLGVFLDKVTVMKACVVDVAAPTTYWFLANIKTITSIRGTRQLFGHMTGVVGPMTSQIPDLTSSLIQPLEHHHRYAR